MHKRITRREFSIAAAGALAMAAFPLASCSQESNSQQAATDENAGTINNNTASDSDAATADQQQPSEQASPEEANMNILFINSSRNKEGNTARMGENLLDGLDYEKLDLIDYTLHPLGQEASDDQFAEVWAKMLAAQTIVIGTPVYWHSMASSLKILIDRMYDYQDSPLTGKQCAFFCQGGGPTELSLENLTYTFERVASIYGMSMIGTATNSSEVSSLRSQLDAALA